MCWEVMDRLQVSFLLSPFYRIMRFEFVPHSFTPHVVLSNQGLLHYAGGAMFKVLESHGN
jgi:hypothetical protein